MISEGLKYPFPLERFQILGSESVQVKSGFVREILKSPFGGASTVNDLFSLKGKKVLSYQPGDDFTTFIFSRVTACSLAEIQLVLICG